MPARVLVPVCVFPGLCTVPPHGPTDSHCTGMRRVLRS